MAKQSAKTGASLTENGVGLTKNGASLTGTGAVLAKFQVIVTKNALAVKTDKSLIETLESGARPRNMDYKPALLETLTVAAFRAFLARQIR